MSILLLRRNSAAVLAILLVDMVFPSFAAASVMNESSDAPIEQAESALRQGKLREAVELATKAIEETKDSNGYVIRGVAYRGLKRFKDAIADFSKAIGSRPDVSLYLQRSHCYSELDEHIKALSDIDSALAIDPKARGAYRQRGRSNFKAGNVQASISDFDRYAQLEPNFEDELWERGLARYYAGQFALAQKSFEDYHKVGWTDIENGLWRLLSQAEIEGLPAAQASLYKYEPKRRPPFPSLYELYSGMSHAENVMEHATGGATDEADRKTRTFYAHLYVGMWFVVNRDKPRALEHIEKAVALRSTDYMWYVARLQLERLKGAAAD
jgi:lipoprotein NlpI